MPEENFVAAPPATRHVFAYGSLMYPVVWSWVVRGQYRSQPATVKGFRRVCVDGHEHPALVVAPLAAPLTGVIYFDVGSDDLARLDHFETSNYARVLIAATVNGDAIAAEAYLALNVEALIDRDWDVAHFEQRGLSRFLAGYATDNAPPA